MPVNVRDGRARRGGNHFVPARFVIPAHDDLADCVAEVRRIADEWKHAPGLADERRAGHRLERPARRRRPRPVGLHADGERRLHHEHPRPPFQAFLAAPVESIYAVSPPSGAALNVSLVSTAERACVTITADVAAVPDSPKLAGCIEDGFAEICSARTPPASSP